MNIEEIRSSGMLELYVLGRLDPADTKLIDDALEKSQELRVELAEIEKALELYAKAFAVMPSPELKDKILKEVGGQSSPKPELDKTKPSRNKWLAGLLTLAALALAFALWNQSQKLNKTQSDFDQYRAACDSAQTNASNQIALLNELNDRNNSIIQVAATEGFPETNLYFHHNPVSQRNFIQVKNLPDINTNQSYQLWSLKANQAPIPLDVFQQDGQLIIPVRHEANTSTYAITIENRGGAQAPNLTNLIGTFTIS